MEKKATDEILKNYLDETAKVLQQIQHDSDFVHNLEIAVREITECLMQGGRVLLCGNGGSAADAQHIAAELSGRYLKDRAPIDAEALHCNTSYLTAVANDYSYEVVFERAVIAKGRQGDVLIAISTSGNSENVIRAARAARQKRMRVIGMTGIQGGKLKELCNVCFCVPSAHTPVIQHIHIIIGHVLCHLIENAFSSAE